MKYLQPNWPAPAQIKAHVTLRAAFQEFEPLPAIDVHNKANYIQIFNQVTQDLALPAPPIWLNQIHGAEVCEALPQHIEKKADASFTQEVNRVCLILTADCLPLFICNKKGTKIAAIHAGWRGLAAGVIENTLAHLNEPADELLVWLGPAIGANKFEVGSDVYEAFISQDAEANMAFKPNGADKWLADLYQLAKMRLQSKSITQIYGGNFCTYTQEELFYSYRRDQGKTGRMASFIWISS